ncbi:MAG: DUF2911 domain-containing protein [Candidatus Aminicenantes bacterium]|nr:MAG: DUF2911 domain-containing protein [Candidatus Aminicenantes bacterium]
MKRKLVFGLVVVVAVGLVCSSTAIAQEKKVRPSLHASVSQTIGVDTVITFDFSRPGVKERTIWGDLVPYGLAPGNKYSEEKPFPWRAGANEKTTIEVSNDVLVDGKPLAAGKYSIHMIPSEKDWIVIFNTNNEGWGSYDYDESLDALRLTVTPVEAPFEEWMRFGFDDLAGTSAVASLLWEKLKVPFTISVAE